MSLSIGSQVRTTDGAIGTSGAKIRVYGFIARASSGGASVINIYNGVDASTGTLIDVINVAQSTTERPMYAGGLYCGAGLFVDVDSNTSFITAIYEQENS